MEVASLDRVPTGTDVAFKIAPRLNAGGRLGRETLALEILTSPSYGEAVKLVAESDILNRRRQQLDREHTRKAADIVRADPGYEREQVIVVGHEDFHAGVVGIVAARLTETFNKPAVLVAFNGEHGRGSGRSVPGFHLYNALNDCAHLMKRFGGHEQAAGLEITRENFGLLRRAVNEVAQRHVINGDYATPTLDIDAEVAFGEIDMAAVEYLQLMEPFGEGNAEPLFTSRAVEVVAAPKVVGRGTGHLSLLLRQQSGPAFRAIGFGMGAQAAEIQRGDKLRIAFAPMINEFRGSRDVELSLKAVRKE
jgi:single-stranded-DNA-specific exonuclease